MNNSKITGRITKDLELKYTSNNVAVCSFCVAVDRRYKNANGEKQTDFFNVVAWRQLAEFVCKYFGKGRLILVDGEMQSRKYTDSNGAERIIWEIVADKLEFMGDKPAEQVSSVAPQAVVNQPMASNPAVTAVAANAVARGVPIAGVGAGGMVAVLGEANPDDFPF